VSAVLTFAAVVATDRNHKRLNALQINVVERQLLPLGIHIRIRFGQASPKEGLGIAGWGYPALGTRDSGDDMKFGIRPQVFKAHARSPHILLAGSLAASAGEVFARQPNSIPEPSFLSLLGAGAVAGIIAYRIKKKK
jgi:hypothetical protein